MPSDVGRNLGGTFEDSETALKQGDAAGLWFQASQAATLTSKAVPGLPRLLSLPYSLPKVTRCVCNENAFRAKILCRLLANVTPYLGCELMDVALL